MLSSNKKLLLDRWKHGDVFGFHKPIQRRSVKSPATLSHAQERLWLIHQLEAGSAYHIATTKRLRGPLQVHVLERVINEVLRRHEVLRTTFETIDARPIQVVHDPEWKRLPLIDLTELSTAQSTPEVKRLIAEETQLPFDLRVGPLARIQLFQLGHEDHIVLWTVHHIVFDGWSSGILGREVTKLYDAFCQNRPSPLAELPVQYADFALWQRQWLEQEAMAEQLNYWKRRLAGVSPLSLPTDHPRASLQPVSGAEERIRISSAVSSGTRHLARTEGATLFMTLVAGLNILLSRYSGDADIALGLLIANRNRAEIEDLIGFFVNTLVLRTDLTGDPTVAELLRRVIVGTVGAYEHQDLPFDRLVEELQPDRDLSRNPLVQVAVVLHNEASRGIQPKGFTAEAIDEIGITTHFDLEVHFHEIGDELVVAAVYNAALLERRTVARMLRHLECLLKAMAEGPGRRVSELEMMGMEERERVIRDSNRTCAVYSRECVHQLIHEQVLRTPEAVAVEYEGRWLTYRQLNERANQLARYLRQRGVGPEVFVGICMERSLEMVIGILGVLKAGGAYLPLDPGYPKERLEWMMGDAAVAVLLTQERLLGLVGARQSIICVDRDWESIGRCSAATVDSGVRSLNPVYAIYTSGSTGRPKAAVNTHEGLSNRLSWMQGEYHLEATDVVLQKTPFSFDVSVWEFFWPLMVGARLVMARPGGHQEGDYLVEVIQQRGVTTMHFVPSMLEVFLGVHGVERCGSLKRVICSGEAMSKGLEERFFGSLGAELHNLYGPTEASIDVTYWRCRHGCELRSVPIGRPIANTHIYILDRWGQVVPEGIVGELHIGGVGLARGYHGRVELTAERFVPDPLSEVEGQRMYRSGDLGRHMGDGNIEYVGRVDQQVKVRGFRIELGEIESVLGGHEAVKEAVVVVRDRGQADKVLVGYVVLNAAMAGSVNVQQLKDFLKGKLPEYMVPGLIVKLEQLPLTVNGKVDRKTLPQPEPEELIYEEPRNAVEGLMVSLWERVLKVSRVGVGDNFFELGGHSLLATQVVSRIREVFGVEFGLRKVFENPTVRALSREVELERLKGHGSQMPELERAERRGVMPLSFAQERLWFLDQLEPGNPAYNIFGGVRIKGCLKEKDLERTIREIVRRHEVLRTVFRMEAGQVVQVVQEAGRHDLDFVVVDLGGQPLQGRQGELGRLCREEGRWSFDLERGPLVRVKLVRMCEEEHVLLFTMHHIVSDGWSMGVLVNEFLRLYEAYEKGESPPLAELPIQYGDYAVWQRGWLRGQVLERQMRYWRECLKSAPGALELPTDRPRPAVQTYRGAKHPVVLDQELTAGLKVLSRGEGVTLFMVLLAGFKVLLSRYSGQEDIVVGSPIANRRGMKTEGLIGFFVNTLVLRTDLSGDPSVRELLRREREVSLGAYEHQDVPFEKLVQELEPNRDLSRSPVFQVMFVLQNTPAESAKVKGLEFEELKSDGTTTKFELTLWCGEVGGELRGGLEYNADLFEGRTIERMAEHWKQLLKGMVSSPQKPISELELMQEKERQEIVRGWNRTAEEYRRDKCIHELFEEQVERTPEAVAVVFEGQQLTYKQLNQRANQMGRHLRDRGVGPEVLVGICMERSIEMVVGLLGVLKAGAGYVPLDPGYPAERLELMMRDARIAVLLTQERLLPGLAAPVEEVLCLDRDWAEIAGRSVATIKSGARDLNSVYAIYTSGSTGQPKSAVNTHEGVRNRLIWMQDKYPLKSDDSVLQKTPFSFDVSVWEFFWPLMYGARLVMARPGGHRDGEYLVDVIRHEKITTLHFVPSMLQAFLDSPGVEACRTLKRVICSGEALSNELVESFHHRLGAQLHNLYGPTEASVDVTYWACERGGTLPVVPIGKPIANTQIYILDGRLSSVPVGIRGQLHIGGVGLARGYLNRAELTAERFVPDPYGERGGERLYRSGDVARYREDGNIEYLGRMDDQVKVRGYRIELGEIESVIRGYEGVREAVAMVRENRGAGDKRLVGYVVWKEGNQRQEQKLVEYVRRKLPEYMVPSVLMTLEQLPLMVNGKVDRKGLPAPQWQGRQEVYEAARGLTEQLMVGIWEQVLRVEPVGVQDNFFKLGGHSLLATQLAARVREVFEVELGLRKIFEEPTVRALSRQVELERVRGKGLEVPRLEPIERGAGPIPLSYAQERLWFFDQLEPGNVAYNIPGAVRIVGELNGQVLAQVMAEIVSRHEVLRTVFRVEGEQVVQVAGEEGLEYGVVALEGLDAGAREAELNRLLRQESGRAFDLTQGPLVRAKLVKIGPTEHVMLFTLHHIVSDGWSMGIVVKEFAELYRAFEQGKPSPLRKLTIQYGDYAVWQRQWLHGQVLAEQVEYWRNRLEGAPEMLELPTDRMRPAVQTHAGAVQEVKLGAEVVRDLNELSQREGVTLFMVLSALFKVLLSRYSGQEDIVVGTPIANRRAVETEGSIGFFVNTLVLRTDLSGEPSIRELLRREREVCLGAYEHQDVPFEKLVQELEPKRALSRSPLFQVMLVFQNAPIEDLSIHGLTFAPVEFENPTALFDLTVAFQETPTAVVARAEFNTDLYERSTICRMMEGWVRLVEVAVNGDINRRISELEMLNAADVELMESWNCTAVDLGDTICAHQLFERQALKTPHAAAIIHARREWTYLELNHRANALTRHLKRLGVKHETLVALWLNRGIDYATAVLAVLKAGAAYVPFDHATPPERCEQILREAKPALVLAHRDFSDRLSGVADVTVYLDDPAFDAGFAGDAADADVADRVYSDQLAYVMYTSGTTGRPKGVQISHRSLVNHNLAVARLFQLRPGDRVLQFSSLTFDIAIEEVFPTWACGGCVVFRADDSLESLQAFRDFAEANRVTVFNLPTAFWHRLVDELETWDLPDSVRLVVVGGEKLSEAKVRLWRREVGRSVVLIDTYGPTETTVTATVLVVGEGLLSIGRPIANTEVHIFDRSFRAVPLGAAGEIFIGGTGVSRGYLNAPAHTAERFVPSPMSKVPGARLYRTGDRGRFSVSGEIHFLGRSDDQVKIRGFRVELGEIERVLEEHDGVRGAVVITRERAHAPVKGMVAYVILKECADTSTHELREFLIRKLPDYMIPADFKILSAFPMTSSGKVDRQALPAPDAPEEKAAAELTETERTLTNIWAGLLRRDHVGVHENFFDLGGDSILSIQIVSRARNAGIHLTPKQVFQYQTIAELAMVAGRSAGIRSEEENPREPTELSPIQRWFFDQEFINPQHFNQCVLLEVDPGLTAATVGQVVQGLVAHHDVLRLRITRSENGLLQRCADKEEHTIFRQVSIRPQEDAASVIAAEASRAQQSLNFAQGPVLRLVWFDLGPGQRARLLVVVHHLAVDGVSWRILLEDLQLGCRQVQTGQPLRWPAKTTSFSRWIRRLSEYARSEAMRQEIGYWSDVVGCEVPRVPVDFEGGAILIARRRSVRTLVDADETRVLLRGNADDKTPRIEEMLLTALAQALKWWTAADGMAISLESHGREPLFDEVDLTRTVGWFTAQYPLVLRRVSDEPIAALKSVKEQLRRIPHHGIGYGLLRYLSSLPGREEMANRAFEQISFNYLGQVDAGIGAGEMFNPAREATGSTQSETDHSPHLLEINSWVAGGRLELTWLYLETVHRRETIEAVARQFTACLRALVRFLDSAESKPYTPSDFPLAGLSQTELDDLINRIR